MAAAIIPGYKEAQSAQTQQLFERQKQDAAQQQQESNDWHARQTPEKQQQIERENEVLRREYAKPTTRYRGD